MGHALPILEGTRATAVSNRQGKSQIEADRQPSTDRVVAYDGFGWL